MPVEGITPKQISDTWGAARGQGRKHEGIDIFAKRGTAVLSSTQGMVAKVGLDSLGGKVVWVIGPDLSRHYYAHLDAYAQQIDVGDWSSKEQCWAMWETRGMRKTHPRICIMGFIYLGKGR